MLGSSRLRHIVLAAALVLVLPVVAAVDSASAGPPGLFAHGPRVWGERAVSSARPEVHQGRVDVAWNGLSFLVVWEETPAQGGLTQIYAARVSPAGRVLDPGGVLLSRSANDHANPTVAAGSGRYLVVWEERPEDTYTDLGAAIVRSSGAVARRWSVSLTDNNQTNPDATWLSGLFLVTWEDQPDAFDTDVFAARVLPSGLTLDGCSSDACLGGDELGLPVSSRPEVDQRLPAVTPVGGAAFVAWEEYAAPTPPDIGANAMALNGERYFGEGFEAVTADGAQRQPAVATSSSRVVLAWVDSRSGAPADLYATVIDGAAVTSRTAPPPPRSGSPVAPAPGDQSEPSAAPRGRGFWVAWTDTRSGSADIMAARLGRNGAVLDPSGVVVAGTGRNERGAAVAAGPGRLLVAYQRDVPAPAADERDRVFMRLVR